MDYREFVDIESAKERFMGSDALFLRFLLQFPERSLFGELEAAVKDGDVKKGFETAHTMKGIAANLSLCMITKPLSDVVETLRAGNLPTPEEWQALADAYGTTIKGINAIKDEGVTCIFS